jgi:hypothetical protein
MQLCRYFVNYFQNQKPEKPTTGNIPKHIPVLDKVYHQGVNNKGNNKFHGECFVCHSFILRLNIGFVKMNLHLFPIILRGDFICAIPPAIVGSGHYFKVVRLNGLRTISAQVSLHYLAGINKVGYLVVRTFHA